MVLSAYEWRCSYQVESVRCRAFLPSFKKAVIPTIAPYNTQLERQAILLEVEEKSQAFKVEFYTGEDGINWRQMPSKKFLWYGSEYLEEIIEYFGGDEFKRLSFQSRLGCKLPEALSATDKLTFEIDAVYAINGFLKVDANWNIMGVTG